MASVDERRNSPFESFLIDDPAPSNHRIVITNEDSSTSCVACHHDLRIRSSKLLTCLHSVCAACLDTLRDSTGTIYTCCVCDHKSGLDAVCDNLYVTEAMEFNGFPTHCSNCEEGNDADW